MHEVDVRGGVSQGSHRGVTGVSRRGDVDAMHEVDVRGGCHRGCNEEEIREDIILFFCSYLTAQVVRVVFSS
jgi:hypothetical protein